MQYDVFICYSRKDTAVADRICQTFDAAGISYFIDRQGITGGMEFPKVLAPAIKNSEVFLLLASENAYSSPFTNREILFAFNKKKGEKLLPYIIDDSTLPDDMEFIFASTNWRTLREHPIEPVLVDDVLRLLGRERQQSSPTTSSDNTNVETITTTDDADSNSNPASDVPVWMEADKDTVANTDDADGNSNPASGAPVMMEGEGNTIANTDCADCNSKPASNVPVWMEGDTLVCVADGEEYRCKMVYVEGGTYMMGATAEQGKDAYDNEKPAHSVTVDGFYIGQTQVTQALWKVVMGRNPSYGKGNMKPVQDVSYYDCQEFVGKLNALTGRTFRLPTEEEWEFAARGGNNSQGYKYSGGNDLEAVAWYFGNGGGKVPPVGRAQANELGLYDMSGNVKEWCSSLWCRDYNSPRSGSKRVVRGGGWLNRARRCRVSSRNNSSPDTRLNDIGLRLVLQ